MNVDISNCDQEPIHIIGKIQPHGFLLVFDEATLELESNALKYTSPDRRPRISIKSWQEASKFYFSVSDNGLGIDLNKYGHKLFRIYQTFHLNPEARGVGLYLTKMQVESLGGSV